MLLIQDTSANLFTWCLLHFRYAGNGSWYQEKINLYDLSVRVAADMQQISVEGLGHNYSENKHWRFVMDNAVQHGLPAFMQLLDLLRDAILNRLAM